MEFQIFFVRSHSWEVIKNRNKDNYFLWLYLISNLRKLAWAHLLTVQQQSHLSAAFSFPDSAAVIPVKHCIGLGATSLRMPL